MTRRCSECGLEITGRLDRQTCSARCRVARSRRLRPILCTCGHAESSHQPDRNDAWTEARCKTCGCAGFDDGRPSDPEDD